MLYRILIVDDEEIIRRGLSETIDWNSMGFEVSGTADSGAAALDMINRIKPHVVLADIRMPGVSGIKLARKIAEDYPGIYVVLLTGFSKFDYAKEAIDYNVFSYLLKPYNGDKLRSVFEKLKREIDSKTEAENIYSIANHALLNREFRDCVEDYFPLEDTNLLEDWIKSFENIILYMFVETDRHSVSRIIDSFENRSVFFINGKDCVFLLTDMAPGDIEKEIKDLMEYYGLYLPLSGYGNDLISCIKDLKKKNREIIYNESGLYHFEKIEKDSFLLSGGFIFNREDIKIIAEEVSLGNSEIISNIKNRIISENRNKAVYYRSEVKSVMLSDIENLFGHIRKISFMSKEDDFRILNIEDEIEKCATIRCVYDVVFKVLTASSRGIERKVVNTGNSIVINVLKIIKMRYMEDLTLELIAEELQISPSHLSRLFKKEARVNFKDYLKNYRIGLAKQKLKNSTMKIYEIAESVGYRDQAYFSDIFKKTVGCSPNKYKNMNVDSIR